MSTLVATPEAGVRMTVHDRSRAVRRDALRNQELVVRAAREVIGESGTDASMEQVASRAGVGVGTVYRHFASKEALIDELVRIFVGELIAAARDSLARCDGTGLESFLRRLGLSFVEHRGYAEKLAGHNDSAYSDILAGLMAELLVQAQQHGQIGAGVTIGDIRATTWALRGVVQTAGSVAPGAWERCLEIHLAGLRTTPTPSDLPSLSQDELARITGSFSAEPS